MTEFPLLRSPLAAGRLTLQNRLAILPHGTAMVRDGNLTEDDLAYFAARAHETLGLVITGASVVSPSSTLRQRMLFEAWQESNREMMRRRCDIIHARGGKIVGQILHLGRELTGGKSDFAPVSASSQRSPRDPYPPHALEEREIETIIDDFARSAENLLAAGYDGIELHAAHGYLIAQFLSPATNRRSDRWGGSPEARNHFLMEIVARIRERCGDGFVLGVRLSADEEIPNGLGVRDTVSIGQALAGTAAVDYLNITLGTRGAYVKDAAAPEAAAAKAGGILRREVGLPVVLAQKILSPEQAESLLAGGAADVIGMARAFIADADFAAKAAAGRSDRIRPCVGLNQDCRAFSPHLHCAVNPEAGRERRSDFGPIRKAASKRRVAVIGGGPAGLEAARVARLRGHDVTLFEASNGLGGQFLLAASLPHRGQLRRIVDHLAGELRHERVLVELGARIEALGDLSGRFDAAIVATGAAPGELADDARGPAVLSWWDVLTAGAPAAAGARRAVFADDGTGFWMSYGVAEMLADAGWRVVFATPSAAIAAGIPHESIEPLLVRLGRAAMSYRVLTATEVTGDGCVTFTNLTSGEDEELACDLVVMQTGRRVVTLPRAGSPGGLEVHHVGDCVTPRRIGHAMFEAQRAARAV